LCQAYHNFLYELKSDIESSSKELVEMAKNQEINFTSSQDRKSKSAKYQKGMPTIRCVCGLRILVVPDLKAMNRAIKNHVAEHKKADYGLVLDSLEDFLTEQILMAACKMNLPNVS
jgi:hypothetical protein